MIYKVKYEIVQTLYIDVNAQNAEAAIKEAERKVYSDEVNWNAMEENDTFEVINNKIGSK